MRRITLVCQQLFVEKSIVKKWEVVRMAGLKANYSQRVDDYIDQQIENYVKMGITYGFKSKGVQ